MKSSHAALAVVGLALAGLWYAGGGAAVPPQSAATAEARVSAPVGHDNLTVYFIHGPDAVAGAKIATLQEALDAGWAVVHETGTVNTLAVENLSSEYELFIQEGDMIRGGRQDRMIALDMLVPPRSGQVPLPAHCVESGRWTNRGGEAATHFAKSDQFAVGNDLRLANASRQQDEVWKKVKVQQDKLTENLSVKVNAPESETSLQLALENRAVQARVAEFEQAIRAAGEKRPNVVGVVFVVNGQVRGHEEYGSNALFLKAWPKLLKSAAADAVAEKTAKATPPAPSVREVERFLAYGGQTHPAAAGALDPVTVPESAWNGIGIIADGTSNGFQREVQIGSIRLADVSDADRQRLEALGREIQRRARTGNPRSDPDQLVRAQTDLATRTQNIGNQFPGRSGSTRNAQVQSNEQYSDLSLSLGNLDGAMRGRANEGGVTEQQLRQLAESWSGRGPEDRAQRMEELVRQLPPRYRQMVEEYFRQLNQTNPQANGEDLTRAITAITRQQIRDGEQQQLAENAANSGGSVPTGGVAGIVIAGNETTGNRVIQNELEPAPNARATANSPGNRLNVNRVSGAAGLATESRDPSRQNAVIHKSFIKK